MFRDCTGIAWGFRIVPGSRLLFLDAVAYIWMRYESGPELKVQSNPGRLSNPDAIGRRDWRRAARLVLYTPAVSYGYCGEIVGGLWIALGLVGLCRYVTL